MKITIELDGKAVGAIDVEPSDAAAVASISAEPPPELLAAARALGAQSAGYAAFSLPPEASAPFAAIEATGAAAALPDLDAGGAAGVESTGKQPAKTKTRVKPAKRGK